MQLPSPSMRVIRMIVVKLGSMYTALRWFVVGLSAMGLRKYEVGLCKDRQICFVPL
jgi:hypothetical protein